MRSTTQKLSLAFVAVLLAHCAVPSDSEPSAADQSMNSTEESFDGYEGLTALRSTAASARVRSDDPGADALAYLTNAAQGAGVKSPEWRVTNIANDVDGLTHVRVMQTYQGIPVDGADCVVHLSNGAVLGATGNVATQLEGTSTLATLAPNVVLATAKEDRFGKSPVVTERDLVEKVIHVDAKGQAHVAFHTSFFNELQGDVQPALWNHLYDGQSGKLLARWNELHTIGDAQQASGAGGNPKWVHSWSGELDVLPKDDKFVATTPALKTLDMKNTSGTGVEVVGTLEGFGDAPINDGHGFAEITLKVIKDWMGRDSINDRGYQIVSRVHYGRNYENAFWDGSKMTYGDGATRFYPLSGGLDVVAHEIHHGFTTFHSKLVYRGESGGLNEGFSDIAGKAAEFYYKATPNWDLGGDVFKQPDKALRYMCDPKKDGKSIDHISQYRAGLDVHYSSGLPNKAFCNSSKRFSAAGDVTQPATKDGVRRVATAFFLANAQYWTASTTFVQGCQGTMDAARALQFTEEELGYLKASWADVGITCN